jgi:exonuclease SbcC
MRPLRLKLQGFGAYLEPQQIAFDDIELFAITGPTGAGKTTLLDALTFALYRETPRAGAKGLGELKHPAAQSAKVELEFDHAGGLWRVVRVLGKENQHRLEYMEEGNWRTHPSSDKVNTLNAHIAEMLGMDYATFTRAILLPQGQFDTFLRGDRKERRETLMRLYGLERLSGMRERVGEHLREAKAGLARLEGEMGGLEEADEARLSAMRETEARERKEEIRLSAEAEKAQKALGEAERLAEKFRELASWQRKAQAWGSQVAVIEQIGDRLGAAQQAENAWPQIEALEAAQKSYEAAEAECKGLEATHRKLQAEAEQLKNQFSPQALEAAKYAQAQLPLIQSQQERLRRYGGEPKPPHPEPLEFDEDRLDHLREAERQQAEREALHKRLTQAESRLKTAQNSVAAQQAQVEAARQELEALKVQGQGAKTRRDAAENALAEAQAKAGVLAHRHLLKTGEPCPLCAQQVEALPPEQGLDLQALETAALSTKKAHEELRERYSQTNANLKAWSEALPALKKTVDELTSDHTELKRQLQALPLQLQSLGDIEVERRRRLTALAQTLRELTQGAGYEQYAEGVRESLKRLEGMAAQAQTVEANLQAAGQKLQAAQVRLQERGAALEAQQQGLSTVLAVGKFATLEALRAARLGLPERTALEKRSQEHHSEGVAIHSRLEALGVELKNHKSVDEADLREQRTHLDYLRQSARAALSQAQTLAADLKRLLAQRTRRGELLGQQAKLVGQVDVWERLSTDLRGDRFQDYLLERYQQGLLHRASELVGELSQSRYRFRLESGEYAVEDRWTEAVRPVRTLSGGESFLASLSLALALSEHLSKGRIGALFLDEGFGTLDAETLDQVAGVLEALPTRGRLVGIVTHVEALAERLPARLVVEKHPSGSKFRWTEQ